MRRAVILAALVLASAATAPAAEPAARPNIVLILGDDVGLGNVGSYGGPFPTPHLDALAAGGTRFEHCFASPLCGPTRAALLTGRYGFRTGMISNTSAADEHTTEIMIPRVLKPAGYATALAGKWSQHWLEPGDWGFDEYLRTKGGGKYWADQASVASQRGPEKLPAERYVPEVMHEFVVDFMTRHRDRPFFVLYSLAQMHATIQRTPDSKPGSQDLYADNNAYMDKLVGRLVAAIEQLGLRERTVIVFTGDNGTSTDGAAAATVNGRAISGRKGSLLEGGSRVPLIVNWPGTTPSGRVLADLTDSTDFLPTLAELAGAKLPEVAIDGHSLVPQIQGRPGAPRTWIYLQLDQKRYARSARWKLTGEGRLFDMQDAPHREIAVAADTTDPAAIAGRKQLQAVLDNLRAAKAE